MRIFLITVHAYRSWTEDNPRGYVQRGQSGIQPPQPKLAKHRAAVANHPPVKFNLEQKQLSLDVAREVCETLGTRPIAASCTATHLHVLVTISASTACEGGVENRTIIDIDSLAARIKSIVGLRLSQLRGTTGNRWFSRGKNVKCVSDQRHFEYLIETYLPRHQSQEHGIFVRWNSIDL